MGMPQNMETDCRLDSCALAGVTHRAQLLGALPPAAVVALEQHVARRAAGDQALDQLGRLAGEGDVAHLPALRLADRQRLDVGVVVGDLEPAELAVTAAGKERRMDEIAERTLAGVEQRVISSCER